MVPAEYVGVHAGQLAGVEAHGDDNILGLRALGFQSVIKDNVIGDVGVFGVPGDWNPNEDFPVLADAIGPVGALILDRGVPPPIEMHDVIRGVERQAEPSRARREQQDLEPLSLLEPSSNRVALVPTSLSVDDVGEGQ